ncbi:MAG: GDSL-type esterase/lipase family protein [Xanthobacteraceae bacterium]
MHAWNGRAKIALGLVAFRAALRLKDNAGLRLLYPVLLTAFLLVSYMPVGICDEPTGKKWLTAWTCSIQGPYPIGTASPQPQLQLALPGPDYRAHDQTFRMIVRPDLFADVARLRFSNWASSKPLVLDGVFVGAQESGASISHGENYPVHFSSGRSSVVLPPGQSVWSDPVTLPFVRRFDPAALLGRKLAISFHVQGDSGEIGWHSEAFTTSYISRPGSGSLGSDELGLNFTENLTSWYFLDALDMLASEKAQSIVVFGDSITNGTGSTINADDRWPDILSLRLHRAYGANLAVVNAGIGGNQVVGPAEYSKISPFPGGPAAVQRLDKDVLSLSGVSTIIWTEGINDFAAGDASAEAILAAMRVAVATIRSHEPGIRVFIGTLTSALGSDGAYGTAEVDSKRRKLNELIRAADFVDSVIDFDRATIDPNTGALKSGFATQDAGGLSGDRLHPSRAGYLAMGEAIDLSSVMRAGRRFR